MITHYTWLYNGELVRWIEYPDGYRQLQRRRANGDWEWDGWIEPTPCNHRVAR